MKIKQERNKGKHLRKRKIVLTDRFYALMSILLGILSMFIFKEIGETDVTGPIFIIFLGTLGYIGTFGEDN